MIIGIGGISNAGKSALAEEIKKHFPGQTVKIRCQDNFAKPTAIIPKINGHTNWEIPDSIDFDRYYNDLINEEKNYDIVIDEGLFVFFDPRFNKLYDKTIFMTLKKKTFFERKRKDFRWGPEPDWYMKHIWDSHKTFCKKIEMRKRAFLCPGENPVDYQAVFNYLVS